MAIKQFLFHEKQMLEDLRGLMQIKSTNRDCGAVSERTPLGEGVYDAIAFLLETGRRFGFRTRMLDGYCGWIEAGEETAEKMVGILGHVDTVPVEADGWLADPFDATVIDGKVYGRGVCDDKGPTLLALYAMKALAESGGIKGKRVRLIVGGDEEGGAWDCMKRYKQTEEIPGCSFSPDATFPTTYAEKGILHVTISRAFDDACRPIDVSAGSAYNVVPAYACATLDGAKYEARGVAAHASLPELGVNALRELGAVMERQGAAHPIVDLLTRFDNKSMGIDLSDAPSGGLSFNPAIVETDNGRIAVKCDLRVPVTIQPEAVLAAMNAKLSALGFQAEADFFEPPLHVDKSAPLITTLQRVYRECTGRDEQPVAMGGGTYARAFPNAVAFGPLFPEDEDTNHKTNEYWRLEGIRQNFQILCNAVEQL